jgi:colicin import membrane protein
VADKVGEAAPADDPAAKLASKEIKAATDARAPEPKPPEPKVKKPPQPQTDQIAEALKKDEVKKPEPKKPDPKPPTPPKKPAQQEPAPQFDPRQVAALLDKRNAQRVATAGNEFNSTPAFGDSKNSEEKLSQSEIGAMQAKLERLWNPPAGAKDPQEVKLDVDIRLKPDGTLAAPPNVLTTGNSPLFLAAKDSAIRAVYQGQPYTMLRPEHYEMWKETIVTFYPHFMSGN